MWQTTKPDTRFLGRQYYKCHECRSFKDTKIDIMWRNLGPESLKHILHEIYSSTQKKLTWHLDYGVSRRGWLWWYVFADAAFFSSRRRLPMTTERRLAKLRCCDDDQMFLAHGWKQWLYRKLFAHGFKNSLPFKEILAQGSKQPPAQIVTCTRLRTASSTESVMYTALLDRCTRLQRASHTNVCCTRLQNQPPVQRNRCTRLQTASCTWTPRRTQTSACKSRLSYPKSLVTMLIRNQQAFHKVYSEVPTQTMVRQNISI